MGHPIYDVAIVGGGAVGCAIAYELAKTDAHVVLLERESDVCLGTSGRNSGVSHAGFNYRPGSLMARLCVEGNKGMEDACRTLRVPFRKAGKLVVAFDERDEATLERLYERGLENGCEGLSLIDKDEIGELAPGIGGTRALKSDNTGVFNPFLYVIHLAEIAQQNGVDVMLDSEVVGISRDAEGRFILETAQRAIGAWFIVNAAGLFCDEIAAMAGDDRYRIYPNRGEYCIVDKKDPAIPSVLVYPAPREGEGLGVHLTTTVDGTMLLGPSAASIEDKADNSTTAFTTRKLLDDAKQLLPELDERSIIGQYAGVRPKITPPGAAWDSDFIVEESGKVPNLVNLIGIESPGLTASLPIARLVRSILEKLMPLGENDGFDGAYHGPELFRDRDEDAQNAAIAENPEYGRVICRCEKVTLGDVRAAYENPLGAHGLVAIKNRTRLTMGRCQGGHCFVRAVDFLLHEEIDDEKDLYFRWGDTPLFDGLLK